MFKQPLKQLESWISAFAYQHHGWPRKWSCLSKACVLNSEVIIIVNKY